MKNSELSSKITKLDAEITLAVTSGHKPHDHDQFREHRRELVELRCQYFGEDSKLCRMYRKNFK